MKIIRIVSFAISLTLIFLSLKLTSPFKGNLSADSFYISLLYFIIALMPYLEKLMQELFITKNKDKKIMSVYVLKSFKIIIVHVISALVIFTAIFSSLYIANNWFQNKWYVIGILALLFMGSIIKPLGKFQQYFLK